MRVRTVTLLTLPFAPVAKLAVIGTGFTGTSIALALRPSKLFSEIAGYDWERSALQAARHLGAVDVETRSAAQAVEGAAVVLVCVPSAKLPAAFDAMAASLAAGAVVSDTSLWKVAAASAAEAALPDTVHFIGGRPVLDAVEEPSGSAFAGAIYCLTPGPGASEEAINAMSTVVTAAGAQPYFLDPAEHDALTAATELLPPAVLATALAALTSDPSWPDAGKLAGPAFDRLATLADSLDATFWETAGTNSAALARWLEATASALLDLRDRLQSAERANVAPTWPDTLAALARWRHDRRQLQEPTMPPMSDLKPNLFGNWPRFGSRSRPG